MRIVQDFNFEAAHRLPNVPPTRRCHQMHGHSYRVELTVDGPVDPATGLVVDLLDVEAVFGPVLKRLDHHTLNGVEGLENPTAELISMGTWAKVKPDLPQLAQLKVFETPLCGSEFDGA